MQFKRFLSLFTLLAAVLMLSGLTFSAEALTLPLPRDASDELFSDDLFTERPVLPRVAANLGNRKIVVFDPTFVNEAAKDELVAKFGGVKIKDLDLIGARAVYLPEKVVALLSKHPGVLRIEDDIVVEALSHNTTQPAEVLPWGVDRIDADQVWVTTTADTVKVAIIDTGIELSHPILKPISRVGTMLLILDARPMTTTVTAPTWQELLRPLIIRLAWWGLVRKLICMP